MSNEKNNSNKKSFKVSKGKLIVTETIDIENNEEYKFQLKNELNQIIRQVKQLKTRAEEIKEILNSL
ncbi:hypothetical protein [Schinkia azotoformans]|uniref:hypothetical protein n=1 Tax=Schinkia azotoformans TaxID=1454 RepID=UPI002DB9E8F3|nr:hypothetical protein [Schinkia azotoformans]MEC1778392.1 hypothetical protein [Schinkia azotoformans]MED4328363.1 hypothetical protein [Schinkia azotoformans]